MSKYFFVLFLLVLHWVNPCIAYADVIDQILADNQAADNSLQDKTIELKHSKKNDILIKKRLNQIYSELEGLKELQVSVAHGVVTLTGIVDSKAAEQKALQFASQMEDVIEVENNMTTSHSLTKRLNKILGKLKGSGERLLSELPLMLLALLVFSLFWIIGSWLSKQRRLFRKVAVNYFIADLLGKLVHLTFILFGIVLALSLLDATALLGTILGAAGIFGLAISFAVRDTVENFIASLLLSIRNPFEVNDFVDIEGFQGSVVRLTSRATILMSFDGNHVRIPNSTVFKAVIVNFTRHPNRRFEFDLGVGCEEDLGYVQELILQTLIDMKGILDEPKPQVIVHKIGDSNVVFRIYGWVNQNDYSFLKVRSEAIKKVKESLHEAHIAIPNPIYDINIQRSKNEQRKSKTIDKKMPDQAEKSQEITDVSADHTLMEQILEDNLKHGDENLLDSGAEKEI